MQGIQYSSLSDEEFERMVYMTLGNAGALPPEVAKELAYRTANNGRDQEHNAAANNPNQLNLPLDQ
jgi:hypothetical protein